MLFKRKTKTCDSMKDISPEFDEGDPEGRDTYKVIIRFNNGHYKSVETHSREQAMELVDTVKGIVGMN